MSTKLFGAFLFATCLALSPITFADSGNCRQGLKTMVESLHLDNTQKTKIKPILEQLKSNVRASASQLKGISTQIDQQIGSESMDQTKVNGLIDQKTKLIGDIIKAKAQAKNQILSALNSQQKSKLQNMMTRMEEKIASHYKNCRKED